MVVLSISRPRAGQRLALRRWRNGGQRTREPRRPRGRARNRRLSATTGLSGETGELETAPRRSGEFDVRTLIFA